MARKLTERQAWLKLAAMWRKPKVARDGLTFMPGCGCGICSTIRFLFYSGVIDNATNDRMTKRAMGRQSEYRWPLTAVGARSRVAFCLKQAKRLARSKPCKTR